MTTSACATGGDDGALASSSRSAHVAREGTPCPRGRLRPRRAAAALDRAPRRASSRAVDASAEMLAAARTIVPQLRRARRRPRRGACRSPGRQRSTLRSRTSPSTYFDRPRCVRRDSRACSPWHDFYWIKTADPERIDDHWAGAALPVLPSSSSPRGSRARTSLRDAARQRRLRASGGRRCGSTRAQARRGDRNSSGATGFSTFALLPPRSAPRASHGAGAPQRSRGVRHGCCSSPPTREPGRRARPPRSRLIAASRSTASTVRARRTSPMHSPTRSGRGPHGSRSTTSCSRRRSATRAAATRRKASSWTPTTSPRSSPRSSATDGLLIVDGIFTHRDELRPSLGLLDLARGAIRRLDPTRRVTRVRLRRSRPDRRLEPPVRRRAEAVHRSVRPAQPGHARDRQQRPRRATARAGLVAPVEVARARPEVLVGRLVRIERLGRESFLRRVGIDDHRLGAARR